jgi:hypothetical protein
MLRCDDTQHQERNWLRPTSMSRALNMSEQPPATTHRTRDSAILLAIAVLATICGVLSFGLQSLQRTDAVTASASDDARGMPLPAGPRKYQ